VTLLTDISDKHLTRLYDESDVLLMAVKDAAANNVILEALAHGLPIIANQHEALKWYSGSSMIEFDDSDHAVRQLNQLYHTEPIQADLREKAFQRAEQLTWDKVAKQMNNIYTTIMGSEN
jgi:glycosyltransferase involved in cell wall biosynthesis